MFEDIETHKKLSKWIIGTFTACILRDYPIICVNLLRGVE